MGRGIKKDRRAHFGRLLVEDAQEERGMGVLVVRREHEVVFVLGVDGAVTKFLAQKGKFVSIDRTANPVHILWPLEAGIWARGSQPFCYIPAGTASDIPIVMKFLEWAANRAAR